MKRCVRGAVMIAFLAMAANLLLGVFPFAMVEGDEQGVINGIHERMRPGGGDLRLSYDYELQPGAYAIAIGAARLTGSDGGTAYFAISAGAAVAAAALAAVLVARLLGIGFACAGLAVLACQEMTRAAAYANSSSLGGAAGIGALLVVATGASWRRLGLAGLLLALAGWCRVDSLALAPAVPVLLWHRGSARTAFRGTAVVAAICVIALLVLFPASGVGWHGVFGTYAGRRLDLGYGPTVRGLVLISSYGLLAGALAGVVLALRRGDFWLPATMAAVGLPLLFLYHRSLTTPKYFYYLAPFLALAVCSGWRQAKVWPRWRWAWLGATCLEAVIGVRTAGPDHRRFPTPVTVARLADFPVGPKRVALVLGCGDLVPHDDGFSIRTGWAYAGATWRAMKRSGLGELRRVDDIVGAEHRLRLLTSTYASYRWAVGCLRRSGYALESQTADPLDPTSHRDIWRDRDRECELVWINLGRKDGDTFRRQEQPEAGFATYFFSDVGPHRNGRLLGGDSSWVLLSPAADGFYAVYERRF